MDNYRFNCPHCEQSLEAPVDMLDSTIDCPACHVPIQLPSIVATQQKAAKTVDSPQSQPSPSAPQHRSTKDCPFCGEEILESAIKCKHCGEFIDGSQKSSSPLSKQPTAMSENRLWTGKTSFLYYIPLVVLGVLLIPFIIGLFIILYAVLDHRFREFTVTNRRVMTKWGIIARTTREVAIRDIRNIYMSQGIITRIFGLGTIEIGSAGTAGLEIKLLGIANPISIRDLIRKAKEELE